MAITTRQPAVQEARRLRRIWKSPTSRFRLGWLITAVVVYVPILAWYFYTVKTQPPENVQPANEPLLLFGIVGYVLVLGTLAYTLRRRFVRGLPGQAQNWLWMHTWIGISTILIICFHEKFNGITRHICEAGSCLTPIFWTDTYFAYSALYGLFFLVASGIFGRLLDMWQTKVIAREANNNGIGIARALEERILELEYTVERLCAGKSEPFKQYCLQAIDGKGMPASPYSIASVLSSKEQPDLQRASETLMERARLSLSLRRQERARHIIRVWRTLHIILATAAMLAISYHAVMELLTNVFFIVKSS
ncbi:MAG TPA: hypothetical protein VH593_18075 [Ktedonobacteraceae bacterium]